MRSLFAIYGRDLRRIATNPAAAVIIAGLVALPSLYAWFNIEASWDPYSQTSGLAVAVVNDDSGTTLRGKPINLGKEIVASLHDNNKIGWVFTDDAHAMSGVKHGDYYASIVIPEDFSARLATVLATSPQQAEIDYYVNEKINAVAPKITSKGASGVVEEVSANFVKTANGIIFGIFNEVGSELEANLPTIEKVKAILFQVEAAFPQIRQAVNTAQSDLSTLNGIVGKAQDRLPVAAQLAKDGEKLAGRAEEALKTSKSALQQMNPTIKQDLLYLQQAATAAQAVTGLLAEANPDLGAVQKAANQAAQRLTAAGQIANRLADLFGQLDRIAGGTGRFTSTISKLNQVGANLKQQADALHAIADAAGRGEQPAKALVDRLNTLSGKASNTLGDILDRYDSEIAPRVSQALDKAAKTAGQAQTALGEAVSALPDVNKLLADAATGIQVGGKELARIKQDLPAVEKQIKELAARIRSFERENNLKEIIQLLRHDARKESEFFASPVALKENRLYPIPNYGSAMSPFFTTLSLWVGALLLVSLLTVEVHEEGAEYRSWQVYFGRYLTFGTLAMLQSLCVTLGDIYLLGTYVLEKAWFVLFGMLLSAAFMLIVYTLVSVFGNVGKAMAIVLLVLQLAGAGGTFPIQVTPPFFQAIHPYLPFTYAISMMREAVGGILWDIVQRDLLRLAIYIAAALVVGLALKRVINRAAGGMVRKAHESGLIH
ncbi:YhgE/Pip domain-containing protein [Cohnella nanjingensis]|uniref:YhgE/Pip domain-containing protein n=1 Tax=Cohnella nanjingensis TaxID=1387779 RepID=A0A7X0VDD0_9BACL|nr:YhgE/Pip domain-containing protein [Cohnella nanjingensis]MBB6669847.1 YhgE/Pip domain-containing protein [Cohnella nanjingensis]